jgi:hypothetical protein
MDSDVRTQRLNERLGKFLFASMCSIVYVWQCHCIASFGRFCTERAEKAPNLVFLLLFSLILCKSKKYYTFHRHIDTNNEIFVAQRPSKSQI